MEVSHENVKSVSGLFFQVMDIPGLMHEPNKSSFITILSVFVNPLHLSKIS